MRRVEEVYEYLKRYLDSETRYINTFEKLYRIISEGEETAYEGLKHYPFFKKSRNKVYGIPDVLNRLVNALYVSINLFEGGKLPIIALIGPTGSGKTLLGKCLEEALELATEKFPGKKIIFLRKEHSNTKIEDVCEYDEDPLSIVTDTQLTLPLRLKNLFRRFYAGDLCPNCRRKINEIYWKREMEKVEFPEKPKKEELLKEDLLLYYLKPLTGKAKVVNVGTKFASIELSNENLLNNLKEIISKANRGILHLNLDNVKNLKEQNLQLLLRISDRRINFNDGSSISIDFVPILYANEELMKKIEDNKTLERRVIKVYTRRNLSYTLEERIIKKFGLPFKHLTPHGLEIYCMFVVGTRLRESYLTQRKTEELIEVYEKFENLKPLTKEELKTVKDRLYSSPPEDGWEKGITSDKAYEYLVSYFVRKKRSCFTFHDLLALIEEISYKEKVPSNLKVYCRKRVKSTALRDVVLATICAIERIEPESIEGEYNYLIELFREKFINMKKFVKKIGEVVEIDKEMKRVCKRLCITDKNKFIETIKNYYAENEVFPSFYQILNKYPELIVKSEVIQNFLPWENIEKSLDKESKRKLRSIIEKMKHYGYDETCALSAIKIASERIK